MTVWMNSIARVFAIKPGIRPVCLIISVLSILLQVSCTKKVAPFEPTDPLGITNKWIYDSMKLYYYWSDEITRQPNYSLSTPDFFEQLLSPKDRFSRISNRNEVLRGQTTAELMGFYYALIDHPFDPQKLTGVITFVIPGGVADKHGLKRGLFFTKINNEAITPQNSQQMMQSLISGASIVLQLASMNSNSTALTDEGTITLPHGVVPQKCVYATRYFEKNNTKTGYLAYFACGENEDAFLLQRIQQFKSAGISEFILDLRFNPGGSVASVAKLAATLVPSFNPDAIFVTYTGNKYGGIVKQSFRQTISFSGSTQGKDMNYLQSLHLGLTRIFILTSRNTASAAELLANNLKPYMSVVLIGEQTLGKDEASFRIEDKRIPRQLDWILIPTIYKVANAHGTGNYVHGLVPDHAVNEFSNLPLSQTGFPGDRSVDKALELVYGSNVVGVIEMRIRRKMVLLEGIVE